MVIAYNHYETYLTFFKSIELLDACYFVLFISMCACFLIYMYDKISTKYPETTYGLYYIFIVLFILLITSYVVLSSDHLSKYQTALSVLVSSALLGAGWWVQATIANANSRKTHTITTIMGQRNSAIFFERNNNVSKIFSLNHTIHPIVAKHKMNKNCEELRDVTLSEQLISGCNDMVYVLNYYEFISAGVINGDLDDRLIKECYEYILISLEKRAFHIIVEGRKHQGDGAYQNLLLLIDRWSDKGSLVLSKANNKDVGLHLLPVHPTDEQIEKECKNTKSNNRDATPSKADGSTSPSHQSAV